MARLSALSKLCDLTAIELRNKSIDYSWSRINFTSFRRVTLEECGLDLEAALDSVAPDVVFIPGWSGILIFRAIAWCRMRRVPAVIMSDSQEIDSKRGWWREVIKGWLLRNGSAAFVAGVRHKAYAEALGMPSDRIVMGYDCVDNFYFSGMADLVRARFQSVRAELGLKRPFVLCSARFVPKKNLLGLIEAFAQSKARLENDVDLVILGDGPLRSVIEEKIEELGLQGTVVLPGFVQYQHLPLWFGLAEAFILASTTEQWGLVVNEAMASGLPVIVSELCGCSPDLVVKGITGFSFDPRDRDELSRLLDDVMCMDPEARRHMGWAARQRVERFSPERFAEAAIEAATIAQNNRERLALGGRILLPILSKIMRAI